MTKLLRRLLPLLLIIACGVYLRAIAIEQTDSTNVIEQPLLDDSFYYFALGRNLADGNGAWVDDQHPTTGFQPLWGAMSIFPALLTTDPITTVTLFQWMGVIVSALACVMVYSLSWMILKIIPTPQDDVGARHVSPAEGLIHLMALSVVAMWYWHPHHVAYSINGMETTLSTLATVSMLTAFVALYRTPSRRGVVLFGISCGVAFLARVDASLLILWLIIAIALIPPIRRERVRSILVIGVMSAIVISPWALFTLAQGKFILPESGSAVRAHTLYTGQADQLPPPLSLSSALNGEPAFARYYGEKMGQFTGELAGQMYLLNTVNSSDTVLFEGINLRVVNLKITQSVLILIIASFVIGGVTIFTRSWLIRGLWLIACLWMILAIVLYSFVVISWWFYERYTLPIAEIVSILMVCVVYRTLLRLRMGRATRVIVPMIVLGITTIVCVNNFATLRGEYAWIGARMPIIGTDIAQPPEPRAGFYEAAMWMNENLPADAKIGAFQSGVMVYYTDAQMINLDGKVNADAHHAMTEGRMWDYICEQGITHVADWPVMVYFLLMQRSMDWQEGNLEQIALLDGWINPMQINRVNVERCP
jgi:hypothetical protein